MGTKPPSGPQPTSSTRAGAAGSESRTNGQAAASQRSSGVMTPQITPPPAPQPQASKSRPGLPRCARRRPMLVMPGSVQLAFPGLKVCLSGRQFSHAVPVEPSGCAALGVLLVDWLTLVVKFKDVGEDREADLHLGRRVLQLVPVVDSIQHGMTNRSPGNPSGETTKCPRGAMTELGRHAWNIPLVSVEEHRLSPTSPWTITTAERQMSALDCWTGGA